MPQEVRGVVAKEQGAPVTVETIVIPDPGPGEAVVAIQACGVCHTDLHYREGGINDEFPFLLGHEAAGLVESVGEGVTEVAPGDFVILNWRAVCGECRSCLRGKPQICFATHNATQKMTLTDGTELSPALGIGAFAEKTLVAAGQCTKVNPEAGPEAAGLLGCGVMAGIGAAINTGGVSRGDSVAVFGCGGVGDAAIAKISDLSPAKRMWNAFRRARKSLIAEKRPGVAAATKRDLLEPTVDTLIVSGFHVGSPKSLTRSAWISWLLNATVSTHSTTVSPSMRTCRTCVSSVVDRGSTTVPSEPHWRAPPASRA